MKLIDRDTRLEQQFQASLHGRTLTPGKAGSAPGGSALRRTHDRIAARLKGRR